MNNYHIYEEIGKGKYSIVYKGRKKKSIEYMAVKSLETSRRKKLLNEVKMFSDLRHPNILRFYSWYETRNHLWVILEYCPGKDLMGMIEDDKTGLNELTTKQFTKDISTGLMYLHSKGIIHCDLKPSNVLFNEYRNVKISDLGLAKHLVDLITSTVQGPEEREQRDMSKRGSPFYMAPELFQDGGVYSYQSDLWALGCVAYELATGSPPFMSTSFTELVDLILHADVQKIENYSPQFNEFVRGLLDKDPTKRWTWDKICKHQLFSGQITLLSIPQQPHFETWCKKQNQNVIMKVETDKLALSTPLYHQISKLVSQSPNQGVDILRLSLNVKKNMLREEIQPYVQTVDKKNSKLKAIEPSKDVKLLDRDQEIHIGCADDDEDIESEDPINSGLNIQETQVLQTQHFMNQSPSIGKPQFNKENMHPKTQKSDASSNMGSSSPLLLTGGYTPQLKKNNSNSSSSSILIPLDQLFTHSSDNSVKPIIGNREIEKSTQDQIVLKDQLPFKYISSEDVNKGIESDQVEQHFENIYNALQSGQVSQNDKLNIMNYFEQIVQTSSTANRLLNSAFTPLLLKLLKISKAPQFKLRICWIIGLLLRHATVIEPEVSQVGIVESMVEILMSKDVASVKRKACAALGEYLFYGATQMDEDSQNPYWEITPLSFTTLIKLIKNPNEDDTVKFYAVKTIENISSQSITTGYKFATPEVFQILINVFLSGKNDNLKISCAIALVNLVLVDNNQVEYALHVIGLKHIVQIFMDGNQRIQQAMITIFNLYLLQSLNSSNDTSNMSNSPLNQTSSKGQNNQIQQVAITTINKLIMEEQNLLPSLIHLLDHGTSITRGKAALSLMLIVKFNVNTIIQLSEDSIRFYAVLDKCLREANDYLKSCVSHLIQQLCECTSWMINSIADEITLICQGDTPQQQDDAYNKESSTSRRKTANKKATNDATTKLKGNLAFLNVLIQFANTSALQSAVFNNQHLPILTTLLNASTPNKSSNPQLSVVQNHLFNIMSKLATNPKILVKQQETIVHAVLKPCIESLSLNSMVETKFLYLKLIIELTTALLSEETIYDYPGFLKQQASEINKIIINYLLPQIRTLLGEQAPLPFYALKLIAILLEKNQQFLTPMKKNKIIQGVLDTYKSDGNNITGHTLTIIQKVIDGSSLEEIFQNQIIEKSSTIFSTFVQSQQDWSYEDLSSLMSALISKILNEFVRAKHTVNPESTLQPQSFPSELMNNNIEALQSCFVPAIVLLTLCPPSAQTNIALFLLNCSYIFSGKLASQRAQLFNNVLPIAKSALNQLLINSNTITVTNINVHNYTLFKRCFKVLHWIVVLNEPKPFKCDKKETLMFILEKIKQGCDDKSFITGAKEIQKYTL